MSLNDRISRLVKLSDYPFLKMLTKYPYCWHKEPPSKVILIVAVKGVIGDWAAYTCRHLRPDLTKNWLPGMEIRYQRN